MTDLVGTSLGPYLIVEQIGAGGTATVYKAYQPGLDRVVAVKILLDQFTRDSHFAKRFLREVRLVTKLEHRAIVPVYDTGEHNGQTYLAMRYMRAGTLYDLLRGGPLSLPDAARILADVAAALDYAHAQGIIHRDIKPNNIRVDKNGHAYLTDFGLAKLLDAPADITRTGEAVGTPAYMAPEQTLGRAVNRRTDVYALGATLFHMVTGRPPYLSDQAMSLALMHVQQPIPSTRQFNPALTEAVDATITRALAKEPDDRYANAGDLARAFTEAIAVDPEMETPTVALSTAAEALAAAKSSDAVTPDLRREIARHDRRQAWQRIGPWASRATMAAIVVLLVGALAFAAGELGRGRAAADQTATAVAGLLNQLAAVQTAAAGGEGAALEPTVWFLQTQIAAGAAIPQTPAGDTPTTSPASATAVASPTRTTVPPSPRSASPTAAQPTGTAPLAGTPGATAAPPTAGATSTPPPTAASTSTPAASATPTSLLPTIGPTLTLPASTLLPPTSTPTPAPSATPIVSLPVSTPCVPILLPCP